MSSEVQNVSEVLNLQTLSEWIRYEPETGLLFWRKRAGSQCKMEAPVGGLTDKGYLRFHLKGKNIFNHRAIWILMGGEVCEQIDHINGDRKDNRWENLRGVSCQVNLRNKRKYRERDLPTGVYLRKSGAYEARISNIFIGTFNTVEEASSAREALKLKMGFTERAGM